jgi:hypothetical protein
MSAIPRGPDARTAYLAELKARLIAKRDGGDVITPATVIAGATFKLTASAPIEATPEPVPVVSAQTSPYSESDRHGPLTRGDDLLPSSEASTRPDEHHLELAAVASALVTVAARLADLARVLGGQT